MEKSAPFIFYGGEKLKFKAEPNLYVKINNKYVQRVTGKKGFYFDDKGEYETENETLVKVLSQHFKIVEDEDNAVEEVKSEEIKSEEVDCKYCGGKHRNRQAVAACAKKKKKNE